MPGEPFGQRIAQFPALKFGALIVGGLITLQFISALLGSFYPAANVVRTGPTFMFIIVLIAIGIPAVIIKRFFEGKPAGETFSRGEFLLLAIAIVGLGLLLWYFPTLVPQAFSISAKQTFSAVGLP